MKCEKCKHVSCNKCKLTYHTGGCRSDNSGWFKCFLCYADVRKCPMCKAYIQKNGGCAHMQCSRCDYDMCWCCMGPSSSHDSILKPCPTLPTPLWATLLLTILFIGVIAPLSAVLGPTFAALYFAYKVPIGLNKKMKYGDCSRCCLYNRSCRYLWNIALFFLFVVPIVLPTFLALGLIATVFAIGLGLPAAVYCVISFLIRMTYNMITSQCGSRDRRQQQNELNEKRLRENLLERRS